MKNTDTYTPIPFEQRKSQNITFKDYANELWKALLPIAGLWAGWKAGKNFFGKASYAKIGATIGAVLPMFIIWRKEKSEHLGLEGIYDDMKKLERLRITNDELRKDNALLEKMIAHEHGKQIALQKNDTPWQNALSITSSPEPATTSLARI